MSQRARLLRSAALFAVSLLLALLAAELVWRLRPTASHGPTTSPRYVDHDPGWGWRYRPGVRLRHATDEFDVEVAINALGYREQRGVFDPAEFETGPPLFRIALEPGFGREVFVRDERTGAPLAGVAALDDDGHRVATTAYDGSTVLEGDQWPEWLTFELGGYEPLRWRVQSHWFFHSQTFRMRPRE